MKKIIFLICFALPSTALGDLYMKKFSYTASGTTVTYLAEACSTTGAVSTSVGVYYDLSSSPTAGQQPNTSASVTATSFPLCKSVTLTRTGASIGLYKSYAYIDYKNLVSESSETNNVSGPIEVCVGPDVRIKTFTVDKSGAAVTYNATVCNEGSMTATKFRVGFWHNNKVAPDVKDMGDVFKGITSLAPGKCEDLKVSGGLRPNGSFTAWCVADSGSFVQECRENNNVVGPLAYTLSNPDLAVTTFSAKISGGSVTYTVRVCNKGTASVGKFYTDVYYHRPKKAPVLSEPGDMVLPTDSLAASACKTLTFPRGSTADGTYKSYAQVDPDDFVSEPNESNNLSDVLTVTVGTGGSAASTCTDTDKDGAGIGAGCTGIPDCNDNNAKISPKATEICGNGVDDDCDLTVDDGCPGVDCTDKDGDSFGVGKGCTIQDCNDADRTIYPWATEVCGNAKDDNCNTIVDDGCPGVNCNDRDMDGYGYGAGCIGVPDCNDGSYYINPGIQEKCGDGVDNDCDLTVDDGCPGVDCTDKDGDSFGVGKDCVLADCDDADKNVYPWAPEVCGDNKDDNCNKIADDGCPGRQCVDQDADRYGVGKGCPGPQDCQDTNHSVNPGAKEICGDGVDNDCDGVPDDGCSTSVDNDGDGYSVGGGASGQPDCNDDNAKINPDQEEVCGDGVDNDCDQTVDDGCPGVDCKDSDGDSWGVGKHCVIADCDDNNAAIHPWAYEICTDSLDNDCDGSINDGCPGVNCTDKDLDSFGVGASCCNNPKVVCKEDCDDSDGGINPWVKERCADDKDNNCNGKKDEGCVVCEDLDSDTYGIGPKCASWDCDDTDADAYPGAPEICNEKDNNCNGVKDDDCTGGDVGCDCRAGVNADSPSGPWAVVWALLLLLPVILHRRGRRHRS